jgi:biofilm PGA synthesis N-glycosyltransferase PgaC
VIERIPPSVSIIVPVLNEASNIATCVDSLLAQDYPRERFELIVVDNGSSDASLDILSAYLPRLVLLQEAERGAAAARNAGIAAAHHDIVAFIDGDCVAHNQWLIGLVEPLEDPSIGVSGGTIQTLQPATEIELFGESLHDQALSCSEALPSASTANWASRTEDLRQIGGFDPEFLAGEDSDLSIRMSQAGHGFRHQPTAIVYHRNQGSFGNLFREGYRHGFAFVKVAKKHKQAFRRYAIRRVYPGTWIALWRALRASITGPSKVQARCALSFNGGKKLGRIFGSLRFGNLQL